MRSASSGGMPRPLRWSLWFVAAGLSGLAVGFVLGLAEPRARVS
ncbi:hypothetical protein [uncultured Friedmanniella sp.]